MGTHDDDQSLIARIADDDPERHDIFIGLVAPIGSSRDTVYKEFARALKEYDYEPQRIRLADLLDGIPQLVGSLPTERTEAYYRARMDAGDKLRQMVGDDSALAALAITKVARLREDSRRRTEDQDVTHPSAYIFDSIKHPREAALLKSVYGGAFWLVSVVEESSHRVKNLERELGDGDGNFSPESSSSADALIRRDEADQDSRHGQQVRDVFAAADYFLPVQAGFSWQESVTRFFDGVFGAPFITPTRHEDAMRHAQAAALRSSAIGRQVGAAIVPPLGAPYLLGTNEVPKPGGGQFRDGDEPDHRDFRGGTDPNPAYTERVIREIFIRLAKAGYFNEERNKKGGEAVLREALAKDPSGGPSILQGTRAKSLIEFTRCLHAEQSAIVDAARSGTSIDQARLYTTTFPCHECTKFIVGVGIIEVQYIEPYPKSLAGELYDDLVDTVPPMSAPTDKDARKADRIPFRPFLGFGPSRFDEVFIAENRKSDSGIAEHDRELACPIGRNWSEVAVSTREGEVALAIRQDLRLTANVIQDQALEPEPKTESADSLPEEGPSGRGHVGT